MAIACDRVRDLASGFVLGALEPAEMAAVREHLGYCRKPHPELRELGGVLPYLAGSLEPVEAPARLRAAVLAAARADLETRRETETVPAAPEPLRLGGVESIAHARVRRSRRAVTWMTRIAAAFAIVGLGWYAVAIQGDLNQARKAQEQVDPGVWAALGAPGSRWGALTPRGDSGASGLAVMMASGHVYVSLAGLEPTHNDEVYTVWCSADGAVPAKAGTFTVDDSKQGKLEYYQWRTTATLDFEITLEARSDVTEPTGQLVAAGTISIYRAGPTVLPTN
jgi:hypothetical protein